MSLYVRPNFCRCPSNSCCSIPASMPQNRRLIDWYVPWECMEEAGGSKSQSVVGVGIQRDTQLTGKWRSAGATFELALLTGWSWRSTDDTPPDVRTGTSPSWLGPSNRRREWGLGNCRLCNDWRSVHGCKWRIHRPGMWGVPVHCPPICSAVYPGTGIIVNQMDSGCCVAEGIWFWSFEIKSVVLRVNIADWLDTVASSFFLHTRNIYNSADDNNWVKDGGGQRGMRCTFVHCFRSDSEQGN